MEDILEGGPLRGGDDPDGIRKARQRAFMLPLEQPLLRQPPLQGVQIPPAPSLPQGLDIIGDKLEGAVPLVEGGGPPHQHQGPLLRQLRKALDIPAEHDAPYQPALIPDRKIQVPGGLAVGEVCHLPLYQHIPQLPLLLQEGLYIPAELGDGEDLEACCHSVPSLPL